MTKTLLKDAVLKSLTGEKKEEAIRFLSYKLNTPQNTIRYWLNKNHINLTLPDSVKRIREFLGLEESYSLLEEVSMSDTTTDY